MILPKFRAMAYGAILCGVCLFPAGHLFAQAPPGPLAPSQPLPPPKPVAPPKKQAQADPRKTLAGFWKLNADDSDDPHRKIDDARQSGGGLDGGIGGGPSGVGFPYPGGGAGGPGGGNGPYGGGPGGRGMGDEDNDNRTRMLALA